LASESDTWLPFDRDVVARSEWAVRPMPGLIAEPEPPPPPPEPPAWFLEEAVPSPVPRRRRRRRRLVRAGVLIVVLALAGSGAAAYFAGAFPGLEDQETAQRQPQPPPPDEGPVQPAARVVAGSSGEDYTCTVEGTAGNNELRGTAGRDILCGLGGDDIIRGGEETDTLLGGDGDDVLDGGGEADLLDGGPGRDRLLARDGSADQLEGGPGRDVQDAGWLDKDKAVKGVEASADPVVVAAGDIACDPAAQSFNGGDGTPQRCRQVHTAALVARIEPDEVLVLGDAQYENARLAAYEASYDQSWGRFKKISRPTPAGRHDRYGGGGYRRYWGRKARQPYYSFDVGRWHIVSLNSNCTRVGGCDPGSPQEQWLRADLAANQARCELAFWHEPLIGSNEPASVSIEPVWQALYDYGVDVVLNGDSHLYERMKPMTPQRVVDRARGIRQFIVGTGGRSLDPFERKLRITARRQARAFGVLELRLRPAGYEWRFVAEVGSTFRDADRARCH
jgi:acid phosphatase type 7